MSRITLKPIISSLREVMIKSIAGKLEKFGFDINGNITSNKPLSEYNITVRNNLVNIFEGKEITGDKDKYIEYIQDSARTFLHILISFKTMEKRGLISKVLEGLLEDEVYDDIIPSFSSISPMAFKDLSDKNVEIIGKMKNKDNDEEDTEYYNFIFMLSELSKEMAKEVPLLFKDYEYNLVHPDFDGIKEIMFNINNIADEEYFEDDFLGWIYQYWVDVKDNEIKLAKGNKTISYADNIYYQILNNLEVEQTQFGEFYTPRWVVKYIVDNTLKPYFEENKKIETIKLLDPACGAGNFLVYSFDVFYDLYKIEHPDWSDTAIINSILDKNIFGVDIQKEPLQITAINLWLKAKKKAQDVNIENFNLFNMNVLRANSLHRYEKDPEVKAQLSLFDGEMDLTEKPYTAEDIGRYITSQGYKAQRDAKLFFKNRFNVIVMNPPYLDTYKIEEKTRNYIQENYNHTQNLLSVFIERSIELLNKKGRLGLVASDAFLCTHTYNSFRSYIDNFKINIIVRAGDNVFDGPKVSSSILVIENLKQTNNKILYKNLEDSEYKDVDILNEDYLIYNQKNFKKIEGTPFNCESTEVEVEILGGDKEIETDTLVGMKLSNKSSFLHFKWEIPCQDKTNFKPYTYKYGKEKWVSNSFYYINWDSKSLKYYEDNGCHRNASKYYMKGINYTLVSGDNPSFRVMEEGFIFDGNNPVILNEDSREYLLAFFNSKLARRLLDLLNFTHVKELSDIKRLPIKLPDEITEAVIVKIVNRIIEIKKTILGFNYISNFYHKVGLEYGFNNGGKTIRESFEIFTNKYNELENELYNLELEIDKMIYKVYELSENDIKVIEEEFPNKPPQPHKDNDIKKVVLNYIRAITKDKLISNPAKLYTDTEIENIIKQDIEDKFIDGYKIVEEIEAILEKPIIEVIRVGAKIGSTNVPLAGKGSKDLDEPLLQQKVLSGRGKNKHVVLWHLTHFLLEFEEDKKYVMQNEIRRLNNNIYRPLLQNIKQNLEEDMTATEKRKSEKEEKLFSNSVKTLETWKVVD